MCFASQLYSRDMLLDHVTMSLLKRELHSRNKRGEPMCKCSTYKELQGSTEKDPMLSLSEPSLHANTLEEQIEEQVH